MRLGYVIVYVPDVVAALAFYEAAFGLSRRFLHESGDYGELETGATALAFVSETLADSHGHPYHRIRPDAPPPGIEIALVSDDVAAAYAKALAGGATGLHAPEAKPWGQTVAYVRDLNGVLIELCSPMG